MYLWVCMYSIFQEDSHFLRGKKPTTLILITFRTGSWSLWHQFALLSKLLALMRTPPRNQVKSPSNIRQSLRIRWRKNLMSRRVLHQSALSDMTPKHLSLAHLAVWYARHFYMKVPNACLVLMFSASTYSLHAYPLHLYYTFFSSFLIYYIYNWN